MLAGWMVFHFSWSELVNDAANKVRQVFEVAVRSYAECEGRDPDEAVRWDKLWQEEALVAFFDVMSSRRK
jgi:hypothetical protein